MNFNPFSLSGKTIVVSGASSGIGKQCAIDCSKMGAKVVLLARNEQRLKETQGQMVGDGHLVFCLDLTDFSLVEKTVKTIVAEVGPVDGVINCAGISTTISLKLTKTETMENFFHTNVYSAIALSKFFCKRGNINKTGASIVFLSSIMGLVGEKGKSLYSMTKGALLSAARSLACEYAERNIRFNCISPGVVITPINQNLPHISNPTQRNELEAKHLLGFGEATDVSNACIFLMSDASRWITGQNLIVDGGYTVR